MLLHLLVAFLLIFWYIIYKKWTKSYRLLSYLPGPEPRFILGNIGDVQTSADLLPVISDYHAKYGPIVKYFVWNQANLSIADYNFIEYILNSDILNKSIAYTYTKKWIGSGLLTVQGNKWRKQRKIINPAFHVKLLEQFVDIFNKQSNVLVKKLAKECDNDGFDFTKYITDCTLDIICESAMGISIDAQKNSRSEYAKSIHAMCRIIVERSFSAVQSIDFLYYFTKNYQQELKAINILHKQTYDVINLKKEQLQKENVNRNETKLIDEFGVKKKQAFLDILLNATDKNGKLLLSDVEIRQEVDTMLFAGHDTTSTATSFALYALSLHQHVQEKVYKEQLEIFGDDKETAVTYNQLQEMRYLEQFIKEVLRFYPPVPFFARLNDKDRTYHGKPLPKGTVFLLNVYVIHRNPEFYPDPEKFDPERFSKDRVVKPYSFLPFSGGFRSCIGQKYAMLELKVLLSNIIRHYQILPTDPVHQLNLVSETILKSKNGIYLRLKSRD